MTARHTLSVAQDCSQPRRTATHPLGGTARRPAKSTPLCGTLLFALPSVSISACHAEDPGSIPAAELIQRASSHVRTAHCTDHALLIYGVPL